jgi:hypothetical protein
MHGTELKWTDKVLIAAVAVIFNAVILIAIHWRAIFG